MIGTEEGLELSEVLARTLGEGWEQCPAWPPDVFASTALLLRRTGAYARVVELHPGEEPLIDTVDWPKEAEKIARRWRQSFEKMRPPEDPPVPREVKGWWRNLVDWSHMKVRDTYEDDELASWLIKLCAVADAASAGLGINDPRDDYFLARGDMFAWRSRSLSYCRDVGPDIARVLPKQHTPQLGITLRSLTHNLALLPAEQVEAEWIQATLPPREAKTRDMFNILLLPWPLEIKHECFELVPDDEAGLPRPADPFRFFRFDRGRGRASDLGKYMRKAIQVSQSFARSIDFIVFPELALTEKELEVAQGFAVESGAVLIAGASLASSSKRLELRGPGNVAVVDARGWLSGAQARSGRIDYQMKHHRWCLDWPQITQYGLTGILPASKKCWEYSDVGPRRVPFWTIDRWLTFGVLICEDLARQDPVAAVIRNVGPNMIFALLMDGPQIEKRWGAKYASVLAEDPGSSVLTLTSLGMSRLSRPRGADRKKLESRERVIALWRDAARGQQEIELDEGDDAALLSVVCKTREEFTCDGRGDGSKAHVPVLSGVTSIRAS